MEHLWSRRALVGTGRQGAHKLACVSKGRSGDLLSIRVHVQRRPQQRVAGRLHIAIVVVSRPRGGTWWELRLTRSGTVEPSASWCDAEAAAAGCSRCSAFVWLHVSAAIVVSDASRRCVVELTL